MIGRIQKTITFAVFASEASHIFCCGLPTLFTVLSLISGLGVAALPVTLVHIHEALHHYEGPMIAFSGLILLAGWSLAFYSARLALAHASCGHEGCAPSKKQSFYGLWIATFLFTVNCLFYAGIHLPAERHHHDAHAAAASTVSQPARHLRA